MQRAFKQRGDSESSRRTAQAKFTARSREGTVARGIDDSPAMIAQRQKLNSLFGNAIQPAGHEGVQQQQSDAVQKVGEEDELQAKFDPVQRVEDEEPLQGKFEPVQRVEEEEPLQGKFDPVQRVEEEEPLQGKFEAVQRVEEEEPVQGKFESAAPAQLQEASAAPNETGLPDNLKSGIESLSGMSMDNVRVHYNSAQPAQLNALAYAQGTDIHVGPGQEQHLPHEAWHVVQQAQGRVKPTMQMKRGVPVNDDRSLETEADVMGAKAAALGSEPVQRVGEAGEASLDDDALLGSPADLQQDESVDLDALLGGPAGVKQDETPDLDALLGSPADLQQEDSLDLDALLGGPVTRARSGAVSEGEIATRPRSHAISEGEVVTRPRSNAVFERPEAQGASASEEHEKHLKQREKAKEIIEGIESAKEMGSETKELVENIEKLQNPPKVESNSSGILGKVTDAYEKFKESPWGKAFDFVSPIIAAVQSVLGMKEKWNVWDAYDKSATVVGEDGKKGIKPDAPPEAHYGLEKAPKGFARHAAKFFTSIYEVTTKIVALVPGGQLIAAGMAIFTGIANLFKGAVSLAKKIYQGIKGEKKTVNSASLLDKAIANEPEAIKLVFNLKLSSVDGSGFGVVDRVQEKLNSYSVSNIFAADHLKSTRIVDQRDAVTGERLGPPKDEAELHARLVEICKNPSSKELIRKDIEESMTGFGK